MQFHPGDLVRVVTDHSALYASDATIVIEEPHPTYRDTGEYMKAHYLVDHPQWGTRTFNVMAAHIKSV